MRKTAKVFGWILLVIGILGFIPNPIVGADNSLFMADALHNLIHLISGAILLWAAYKAVGSVAMWLKTLGIIYLLVVILSLLNHGSVLGMMMNGADTVLHIIFAAVFLWVGFKKKGAMAQSM
jgi:hypothetical protein